MEPGSAGEQETGGHWSPSGPGDVSVPLEMAFCPFPALALLSEGAGDGFLLEGWVREAIKASCWWAALTHRGAGELSVPASPAAEGVGAAHLCRSWMVETGVRRGFPGVMDGVWLQN